MAMIFKTQAEYNLFYERIKYYAKMQALWLFSDTVLREDAIDKAMDRVVDWLIKNQSVNNLEAFTKTIISNSLKNSSGRRKLELVGSNGENKIYQVIVKKRGRPLNK